MYTYVDIYIGMYLLLIPHVKIFCGKYGTKKRKVEFTSVKVHFTLDFLLALFLHSNIFSASKVSISSFFFEDKNRLHHKIDREDDR